MISKTGFTLSKRLSAIVNMAGSGNIIADIGTDHAYVPISLIVNGNYQKAIAADINKHAVEIARQNIENHQMSSRISCVLSDGLDQIETKADCIVISGMGGELICSILTKNKSRAKAANKIIIQPQSKLELVRASLLSLDLYPEDETILYEDGHFYIAMKLTDNQEPFRQSVRAYGMDTFFSYGLLPLHSRDSKVFQEYVSRKISEYEKILTSVQHLSRKEKRIENIKQKLHLSKFLRIRGNDL